MNRVLFLLLTIFALPEFHSTFAADDDASKDAKQKEPRKVFISPDDAGDDYPLQGEYSGTIKSGSGEIKLGVQVIALGDGNFRAVAYPGGLPGDGWKKELLKYHAEAKRDGDAIRFSLPDQGSGELTSRGISIRNSEGTSIGDIPKVHRKSPTLGRKPPEGAVVLFDGSTADHFKGGRLSEDKLLMEGVTSKELFGSFKLHLEFRLPFQPFARGQGRGNSGCYMQGRYETQILDSFGLEGEHNECGGVYTISPPAVNMCFPPLTWQTYDVDYTAASYDNAGKKVKNARMTVLHNGVKIHDNLELDHATTAHPVKEGPEPGPIYLQNHGNPVRYRNIWVVPTGSR
ncbi:MAG: DUF1080 domain-containing protein [Planctomycetota bacterium]|nr:DUF1080 domain-containing protein [Planctomycetota bacterium]MDA1158595.1 DUF1080 domain-containing protein [Planctomycetota bacterium]